MNVSTLSPTIFPAAFSFSPRHLNQVFLHLSQIYPGSVKSWMANAFSRYPKTLKNEEDRSYFARSTLGPLPCLMLLFNLQSIGHSPGVYSGMDLSAHLSHWVAWLYIIISIGNTSLNFILVLPKWKEGIFGRPFCLDLSRTYFFASDPDYFISARSCCDQYEGFKQVQMCVSVSHM